MYSSTAPGERSGICHDAKEEIFSKISKMRACSMKKRHSAFSCEETWRQKRRRWPWGPRRDSSLLAAPSLLEFSMLSGRFTQTWLSTAQCVSELVCLLGDKRKYFIFELFYYSLAREFQRSVSIWIKIEFFKFLVYFVSFPRSKSLESPLLGHGVFFESVVIHALAHFVQEVCEECLRLG